MDAATPRPTNEFHKTLMNRDFLNWLAKRKRRDLMAAGVTEPDLFELRRVGNAYRTDPRNLRHGADYMFQAGKRECQAMKSRRWRAKDFDSAAPSS